MLSQPLPAEIVAIIHNEPPSGDRRVDLIRLRRVNKAFCFAATRLLFKTLKLHIHLSTQGMDSFRETMGRISRMSHLFASNCHSLVVDITQTESCPPRPCASLAIVDWKLSVLVTFLLQMREAIWEYRSAKPFTKSTVALPPLLPKSMATMAGSLHLTNLTLIGHDFDLRNLKFPRLHTLRACGNIDLSNFPILDELHYSGSESWGLLFSPSSWAHLRHLDIDEKSAEGSGLSNIRQSVKVSQTRMDRSVLIQSPRRYFRRLKATCVYRYSGGGTTPASMPTSLSKCLDKLRYDG